MPSAPSAEAHRKCPHLRPRVFQSSIPGVDILQTGSVQAEISSQVTRPAFFFWLLDLHDKTSTYARSEFACAIWLLLIGVENDTDRSDSFRAA
jgi:hypothetical protein